MRITPLVVAALTALTLSACSDSSTDRTQTKSIEQGTEPVMRDDAPAAVPEPTDENQTDEYTQPAAPAN